MELANFLEHHEKESMPEWLEAIELDDEVSNAVRVQNFFSSKLVFYPGSGSDGQPVQLFGSNHACHCFVYADYGLSQERLETEITNHGFEGYSTFKRIHLKKCEILSHWQPHLEADEFKKAQEKSKDWVDISLYAFLEILQRDTGLDDTHGAKRLAILFLGADGIACYDALFCQQHSKPLFGLVLQDHGLSGNYDRFGKDGLMERVARRTNRYPQYLLVANNTHAWQGYMKVPDLNFSVSIGAMHHHNRYLFKHLNDVDLKSSPKKSTYVYFTETEQSSSSDGEGFFYF